MASRVKHPGFPAIPTSVSRREAGSPQPVKVQSADKPRPASRVPEKAQPKRKR
jgi:hypothetical protein